MQKTKKKTEFKFIALRVGFLLALIFVVLLPVSLAIYYMENRASSKTNLQFGTVSISIATTGENATYFTVPSNDKYNGIYPNQEIAYSFDLKNQKTNNGVTTISNIDIYSIYAYEIKVLYGAENEQEDITEVLKNYLTIEETSEINYVNEENRVVELTTQNPSITIEGKIYIEKELPNEIEFDGRVYYFNRKTRVINGVTYTKEDYPPIQFELRLMAEAIQKNNNTETDPNGNKTISASAINYFVQCKQGVTSGLQEITTTTSSITLSNADNYEFKDMKIYGNSTQKTVEGTNLFNPKGNAVKIGAYYGMDMSTYTAGDYTIKIVLKEGKTIPSGSFGYVYKLTSNASANATWMINSGAFTGTTTDSLTYCRVRVNHQPSNYEYVGVACYRSGANETAWQEFLDAFDIYMVQGRYSADEVPMNPYVGGVDSPNPEYPQEIQSFGEKTVNLFDINNRTLGTLTSGGSNTSVRNDFEFDKYYLGFSSNNYYYPNNVKYYDISETEVKITVSTAWYGIAVPYKTMPNSNYNFSAKNGANQISISFYKEDGTYISSVGTASFTTPGDCYILVVVLRPAVKDAETSYKNIQLQEGSVATGYEPYGKYKIEVTQSGKNLFDINSVNLVYNAENVAKTTNTITFTNKATKSSSFVYYKRFFEAGKYTFSGECSLSDGLNGSCAIYREATSTYIYNQSFSGIFAGTFAVEVADEYRICLFVNYNSIAGTMGTYTNIQIDEGEFATAYEPYEAPKTTKIYLDEPLRKVGDVADYIDLSTGKVVRKIGFKEFDGNEEWFYNDFFVSTSMKNKIGFGICSHFLYNSKINEDNTFRLYPTTDKLQIACSKFTSVSELKAFLKEEYSKGTPMTVYYQYLDEDIVEEVIDIPLLLTFKGTNYITINGGGIEASKVEFDYYTKAPIK